MTYDQELTVAEAAQLLEFPQAEVDLQMKRGTLPFHLTNGQQRIFLKDVLTLRARLHDRRIVMQALADKVA